MEEKTVSILFPFHAAQFSAQIYKTNHQKLPKQIIKLRRANPPFHENFHEQTTEVII